MNGSINADTVMRVGRIHTFSGPGRTEQAVALRDGRILATAPDRDGLDDLIGPATTVVDDPTLTVMPAFSDTHMHLEWAAADAYAVPLSAVSDLDGLVAALSDRAGSTPPGQWVVGSADWHESALAERRMPTRDELDRVSTDHPVAVRRGGHNVVVNSRGLDSAGIDENTPEPVGGRIVRDAAGRPTGWLIGPGATGRVLSLLPEAGVEDRVDALAKFVRTLNRHGITAVRDAGGGRDAMDVYQQLRVRGGLSVRTRMMVLLPPGGNLECHLNEIERWPVKADLGDDMLRVEGLKLLLDGGVENGALEHPYLHDPSFSGNLLVAPDDLSAVLAAGLSQGWRFAVHTVGDRALKVLLDVYEQVIQDVAAPLPRPMTVEHAMLAPRELRARVIEQKIAVTVQYMLHHRLAANEVQMWGADRANSTFPIREWIEEGATIAGGSDAVVASWDVMAAVHGMQTRDTASAGVLGTDSRIDRYTAFDLYTARAAELVGDGAVRGKVEPGLFADLVAFRDDDPLHCDLEDLPQLKPVMTLLSGNSVYDPDGLVSTSIDADRGRDR